MKRTYYIVVVLIFFLQSQNAFSQGLKFNGNECPINERTSLNVFNDSPPKFSGKLNISFLLSLHEPSKLGYIVRIKNRETGTTFNLSYDNYGDLTTFKFNEEGKSSLITAHLNKESLQESHWFSVSINFDLQGDSLHLNINNNLFRIGRLNLQQNWIPDIYFGKSDHLIDVPSFAIKQLTISDNKSVYNFPLKENSGNKTHSLGGIKAEGSVANPVWLINNAYHWSHKQTFSSSSEAGYNFDLEQENVYVFNRDSLTTYNVRTGDLRREAFKNRCPLAIYLGTNFLDSKARKLYVYEVYNPSSGNPSVAVLDLEDMLWSVVSFSSIDMQLHHHSTNYNPATGRYYIFGGFGNLRYSKDLHFFDLGSKKWETLKLGGDKINPRYFSSMGYRNDNNSLYIFAGMGNESGDQIVGRTYFYQLHKIDLATKTATKMWDIPWTGENVVPVREMVIQDDSCFYTLCYPEHFSNSFLKLYRFSMDNGSFQILGDSIPIHSDKIKTNANLYYSKNLNNIYTIVQEFDANDVSSKIKLYSLASPPVSNDELMSFPAEVNRSYRTHITILLALILGAIIPVFIYVRKKRAAKRGLSDNSDQTENYQDFQTSVSTPKANSIYLFGGFTVYNRDGRDITYMFSTKLKQTILAILQYSHKDGISSQRLSELLWPDKPDDKVKNSRGVTINLLRKVLTEIDGIELIHENSSFKIVCSTVCYCDYLRCLELIDFHESDQKIYELIGIVMRGKFLNAINLPELDKFKEFIERKLQPVLLIETEKKFRHEDYNTTIALCKTMFYIDPISDDAIYYMVHALTNLKQGSEAKKQYFLFTTEYKKMMNQEYGISFSSIVNNR